MFESLTDRLQAAFSPLRKKGRLSEADVRAALRDVRMALLEADVNFRVVRQFVADVEPEAIGAEVLQSLTPAQAVIRIVRDHLVTLLGGGEAPIRLASSPPTVILLVGLQGAGKTTAAAKLARWFHRQGRHPLMIAADIYRPAAVDQLQQLGQQAGVPVFHEPGRRPEELVRLGLARARQVAADIVIVDTAGRLHVDDDLMAELDRIVAAAPPDEALLVVDAMTGQDAVTVAEAFRTRLALTGLIMTKLDGDARGGAALSIRQVTGLPIKMAGVSEKLDGLEPFQPERMAGRILGMGDVLGLIEKAEAAMDAGLGEELSGKLGRDQFTLDDYLTALRQLKKMGPLSQLLDLIPGMGGQMKKLKGQVDDRALVRVEAVLSSMTLRERRRPQIIDGSRRRRIARGSGTTVQEVNRVLKGYEEMRKLTRQMRGGKRPPRMPAGLPGLPPDLLPPK
jgi:signal recognition particle subunit SRP54